MTKRITNRPLKPAGRKAILYDEEIAAEICRRIIAGEGLRGICATPDMPHRDTVYQWLAVQPTFSDQYTRARAPSGRMGRRTARHSG